MKGLSDKARRRRLAVILLMPLCMGIVLRWPTEVWGYLHFYRALHFGTIPIPQDIGVYAIKDGTLVRFNNELIAPDFDSSVEFVFYSEVSRYSTGQWAIWRLLPQIESVPLQQGQPLWTQWLGALERFDRQLNDQTKWSITSNSPAIKCWVRTVPGQPAMVRITPAFPPGPGLYMLAGVDTPTNNTFYVQREKLRDKYATAVKKTVEAKHWAEALHTAEIARAFGASNANDVEEIRVRLTAKVVREAMSANRWNDAERVLELTEKLQTDDPELREVRANVQYRKAMIAARDALTKEDWDQAAVHCEAALTAKPDDWQAQALYDGIPRLSVIEVKPPAWYAAFSPEGLALAYLDGDKLLTLQSIGTGDFYGVHGFRDSLRLICGSEDLHQWVALEGEQLVHVELNTDTEKKSSILGARYASGSMLGVQQFALNDLGTLVAIDKRWTQEELAEWGISERFKAETGAAYGNAIVIWDLTQKKAVSLVAPAPQRPPFGYLAFGPKSTDLFTLDQNGDIESFNLERGVITRTFPTSMKGARVWLLPDRKHLVCSNEVRVMVLSVSSGETIIDFSHPEERIKSVAMSSNLRLMAIALKSGVQLWSLDPRRVLRTLQEGQGVTINHIAMSPDGVWLAVASNRSRSPLGLWRFNKEEQALAQMAVVEPEDATPEATLIETPLPSLEPTPTEAHVVAVADESAPSASATIPAVTETAAPVYGSPAWNGMIEAAQAKSKITLLDEGPNDPGFAEFRGKLLLAVEKRDTTALLSVVTENILNSAGEERGKQTFGERWKPENPRSEVWRQLGDILKLGGRFNSEKTKFTAPFVYTELRAAADQIQEIGVILGEGVSLRSVPSAKSRLVEKRSHEIVKLEFGEFPWFEDQDGGEYPWFGVTLPGGETAYVSGRFIRCPLDYHAKFEKKGDAWRLIEFANEWPRGD